MAPTMKITVEICKVNLRPYDSMRAQEKAAPKKAAAWKQEVTFEETLAYSPEERVSRPKYALNDERAMVVPMNAPS